MTGPEWLPSSNESFMQEVVNILLNSIGWTVLISSFLWLAKVV